MFIRVAIAKALRLLFKIPFFRIRFYGIHKRIIAPLNLFKGVVQQIVFNDFILLELHIDDWIQENIYFLNSYETAELQFLQESLKPQSRVLK